MLGPRTKSDKFGRPRTKSEKFGRPRTKSDEFRRSLSWMPRCKRAASAPSESRRGAPCDHVKRRLILQRPFVEPSPYRGTHRGEPEALRHHADHGVWRSIDPDDLADDVSTRLEQQLPRAMTEDGRGSVCVRHRVRPGVSERRRDAEQGEEIRRCGADGERLRPALRADRACLAWSHCGKGRRQPRVVEPRAEDRPRDHASSAVRPRQLDLRELRGIAIERWRVEEDGIADRDRRGRAANARRQ